jgi:acetyl-CoA synthetase
MDDLANPSIQSSMKESRRFPPPPELSAGAWIKSFNQYQEMYDRSVNDADGFWLDQAKELLSWFKEPTKGREWKWDTANRDIWHRFFADGELNISYNCLDRHLETKRDKVAIIWQGDEDKDSRKVTYGELYRDVCKFSNVLKSKGVKKGDRVAIYLPMVPEALVAMLACTRIGAVHSVVFGGFSAEALRDRILDSEAKVVVTTDISMRSGKHIPAKATADIALAECPSVTSVVVVSRTGQTSAPMTAGRDSWYHDEIAAASESCPPEHMNAEDPLFILYTSGSTGKPKGVLHTQGGYLVYVVSTTKYVFDLHDQDIYWCTADIGWVTGHSYAVYGPLALGVSTVIFEGVPSYPDYGRLWQIVDKYKINVFYTAPTVVRALMAQGEEWPKKYDLSSLRILSSVGEPINPEAWMWYYENIGRGRCPVVDTYWQTENGGHIITPLPGAMILKPGSASRPFFGIRTHVARADGSAVGVNEGVALCITEPWPGLMRTLYGDHQRFIDTYYTMYPDKFFTGDGCRIDEDGDHWLMGRIDDVVNVSGHRIGTAEVESALVSHPRVAEAAVTGFPHEIKGQGLYAYVILVQGSQKSPELLKELVAVVQKEIGPIARPDHIQIVEGLPKTRSGKIMRRILRKIAANAFDELGDTSTLADPSVVDALIQGRKEA